MMADGHRVVPALEVSVPAQLAAIERVIEAVDRYAEEHALEAGVKRKVAIVVDELLSNTISYGLGDGTDCRIDICLEYDQGRVTLQVSDNGLPFNPFEQEAPDTSLSVRERPIGGLGLLLVTRMTDRRSYERLGNRNHVTLVIDTESLDTAGGSKLHENRG